MSPSTALLKAASYTSRWKPPASTAVCTAMSVRLWFCTAVRARPKRLSMALTRVALVVSRDSVTSALTAWSSWLRAFALSSGTAATAWFRFSIARS